MGANKEKPLAVWVVAARRHKRWTQDQLGEALSVAKANVSHWENGRHEPSFSQLLKIRDATGYPLTDVGPHPDWPLPDIARETITALQADQRRALAAAIAGFLTFLAPSERSIAPEHAPRKQASGS